MIERGYSTNSLGQLSRNANLKISFAIVVTTLVIGLSSCGTGDSVTNVVETPARGCSGCLNMGFFWPFGPNIPLPELDFVITRPGTDDFAFRTKQTSINGFILRLAVSAGGQTRFIDTFKVDWPLFSDKNLFVTEPLPLQWCPYGENKLLVEFSLADSTMGASQTRFYGVLNLDSDSLMLFYNDLGTDFFRTSEASRANHWSPYSKPGHDTLYEFRDPYEFRPYSFQSRVTTIDYETIPFRRSPDDKHLFQRHFRNWPNWWEQDLWLDGKLVNHNFDTAVSARHWAWSEDSRYAGFLWLAKGPAPMPVVPNLDTLPSDRFPCQMEEIAIFDVKSPRTDSLGRPIPVHRWKPHEKLCLYAVHTQRFAFNNRGNLLMGLQDRDRNVSNLYEVTIDGRLVRQLTNY